MSWTFKGESITSIEQFPADAFGFTYVITRKHDGKKYYGKKQLYSYLNKPLTKKDLEEQALLKKPGKKKTKKLVVWKKYFGSEPAIQESVKELGLDAFTREILDIVFDKKMLTYMETKMLFVNEVLERSDTFNSNIAGTHFKSDFL